MTHPHDRILRKKTTLNMVGLSDATIWRMERDGRFPKRIRMGAGPKGVCGWLESEINAWLAERAAEREGGSHA